MMPETRASRRPFLDSHTVRALAISAVVGAAVGLVMSLNNERMDTPGAVVSGVIIGLTISLFIDGLLRLFDRPLCRMRAGSAKVLRVVIYLVGGSLGWSVGLVGSLIFIWRAPVLPVLRQIHFIPMMLMSGGIAIAVGLVLFSYGQLRESLERSVARLKEHEYAEKELELARAIQSRLLPPPESEGPGYRVSARNLAAHFVAGDFYDVFPLADGTLGLVVADVAGKGIGASLIMATVKAVLPLLAGGKSVDRTLSELNSRLSRELGKREFVALAFAKFDPVTGQMQLANAGLPDPYLLRRDGAVSTVTSSGERLPLGVRSVVSYGSTGLQLEPGDRFLMFSDGLAEAPVAPGEPLGYERLGSLIAADGRPNRPGEWLDGLFASIRMRTAETLEDDWTALLLERT